MAGTYFKKRRKLGILDKDLGSSDVNSVLQLSGSLVLKCVLCQLVEGLFPLNMDEID